MLDLTKLIEYNNWANRRIADQIRSMRNDLFTEEVGGSFPSIRLTMVHIMESDWLWMHRFNGIPLVDIPDNWSTDNAQAVVNIWTPIQDQTLERVQALSTDPGQEIHFITKKGTPFSLSLADLVMHIANHGTYHRGQIVNMIRILGQTPVNTDYFIFCTVNR
jgi:uncharacterized damage-inducible protein DinB